MQANDDVAFVILDARKTSRLEANASVEFLCVTKSAMHMGLPREFKLMGGASKQIVVNPRNIETIHDTRHSGVFKCTALNKKIKGYVDITNVDDVVYHNMYNIASWKTDKINKSSFYWLLDMCIEGGSRIEGSDPTATFPQIANVFKALKHYNKIDHMYMSVVDEYVDIANYMVRQDNTIDRIKEGGMRFFAGGWNGHYISVGYDQVEEDAYNFILVNAGQCLDMSSSYIGPSYYDNCIVIYESVKLDDAKLALGYLTKYRKSGKASNSTFGECCMGLTSNLLDKYKKKCIVLESQSLGTCAFTNALNIIYYIAKKHNHSHEQLYEFMNSLKYNIAELFVNGITSAMRLTNHAIKYRRYNKDYSIGYTSMIWHDTVECLHKAYGIHIGEYMGYFNRYSKMAIPIEPNRLVSLEPYTIETNNNMTPIDADKWISMIRSVRKTKWIDDVDQTDGVGGIIRRIGQLRSIMDMPTNNPDIDETDAQLLYAAIRRIMDEVSISLTEYTKYSRADRIKNHAEVRLLYNLLRAFMGDKTTNAFHPYVSMYMTYAKALAFTYDPRSRDIISIMKEDPATRHGNEEHDLFRKFPIFSMADYSVAASFVHELIANEPIMFPISNYNDAEQKMIMISHDAVRARDEYLPYGGQPRTEMSYGGDLITKYIYDSESTPDGDCAITRSSNSWPVQQIYSAYCISFINTPGAGHGGVREDNPGVVPTTLHDTTCYYTKILHNLVISLRSKRNNGVHRSVLLLISLYLYKVFEQANIGKHYDELHDFLTSYVYAGIQLFKDGTPNKTAITAICNIIVDLPMYNKLFDGIEKNSWNATVIGLVRMLRIQYGLPSSKINVSVSNIVYADFTDERNIVLTKDTNGLFHGLGHSDIHQININIANANQNPREIFFSSRNTKPYGSKYLTVYSLCGGKHLIDNGCITRHDNTVDHTKYRVVPIFDLIQESGSHRVREIVLSVVKVISMFEQSFFVVIYSDNDGNYRIDLTRYKASFVVTVNCDVEFVYNGATYSVTERSPYTYGLYDAFSISDHAGEYIVIFDGLFDEQITTFNKKIAPMFRANRNRNTHASYSYAVSIINTTTDGAPILNDIKKTEAYLQSCFRFHNYRYFMDRTLDVYNAILNNHIVIEANTQQHLDGPYSMIADYVINSAHTVPPNSHGPPREMSRNIGSVCNDVTVRPGITVRATARKMIIHDVSKLVECFDRRIDIITEKSKVKIERDRSVVLARFVDTTQSGGGGIVSTKSKITLFPFEQRTMFQNSCGFNGLVGDIFPRNIDATESLYTDILQTDRKLSDVYELIMGSGKSNIITPLLSTYLLSFNTKKRHSKDKILICVPESLLAQTYDMIIARIVPVVKVPVVVYGFDPKGEYIGFHKQHRGAGLCPPDTEKPHIILTTDVSFKSLHLTNIIDRNETTKRIVRLDEYYIIFDEIDHMANPLTCNLNIKSGNSTEINEDDIAIIARVISEYYAYISSDDFWERVGTANYESVDGVYNVVIHYDNVSDTIDKLLASTIRSDMSDLEIAIRKHINGNIARFFLTTKCRLEYGLADAYPDGVVSRYKFGVIPYSSLNTPMYGSEYTDPIFVIFMTYCYYRRLGIYRTIDKKEMVAFAIKSSRGRSAELLSLLTETYDTVPYFRERIYYDTEIYRALPDISPKNTAIIDMYTRYIVYRYIGRYDAEMYNISMTELMMSHNYNTYVSFTGTPYMHFLENIPSAIGKQMVKRGTVEYISPDGTIERVDIGVAICSSILKMDYFYQCESNKIKCLLKHISKPIYNTFIDVGAFFTKHSINELIHELSKVIVHKSIVYIDSTGKKRYILREFASLDKDFLGEPMPHHTSTENISPMFFVFDNPHITGIDFKEYMPDNSKALTTISYNSRLRDVAQGIFRLRKIFDGDHKSDYIVTKKVYDAMKSAKCDDECDKGRNGAKNSELRVLYRMICNNERLYGKQQHESAVKQNILALHRAYKSDQDNLSKSYAIDGFAYPPGSKNVNCDVDIWNVVKNITGPDLDPASRLILELAGVIRHDEKHIDKDELEKRKTKYSMTTPMITQPKIAQSMSTEQEMEHDVEHNMERNVQQTMVHIHPDHITDVTPNTGSDVNMTHANIHTHYYVYIVNGKFAMFYVGPAEAYIITKILSTKSPRFTGAIINDKMAVIERNMFDFEGRTIPKSPSNKYDKFTNSLIEFMRSLPYII